jgi:3-oxoacyl-[acyl-carrier-protein] synthase III
MSGIIYSDYYTPEDTLPTSEFVEAKIATAFIKQYKLEKVFVEKKRNQVEIFKSLLDRFFAETGIKPGEISHIIYTASQNLGDNTVCIPFLLQSSYKMGSAAVILLKQSCNSVMQGLQAAAALVDTGKSDRVMILSMSYGTPKENRFIKTTVVGDGAGIMVVGKEGYKTRIVDFISRSDGRYSWDQYEKREHQRDSLAVIRDGSDVIMELLKRNRMEITGLATIIPQNLNYLGFFAYARILGIQLNKIYAKNISLGGHLVDVDTIRNYSDYEREILAGPGQEKFVLFSTSTISGYNLTYDAMLLSKP